MTDIDGKCLQEAYLALNLHGETHDIISWHRKWRLSGATRVYYGNPVNMLGEVLQAQETGDPIIVHRKRRVWESTMFWIAFWKARAERNRMLSELGLPMEYHKDADPDHWDCQVPADWLVRDETSVWEYVRNQREEEMWNE